MANVQALLEDGRLALDREKDALSTFYRAKTALDATPRADRRSGDRRIQERVAAERDYAAAEALADAAQERTGNALDEIEAALKGETGEGE